MRSLPRCTASVLLASLATAQLPVWQQQYPSAGPSSLLAMTYDEGRERVLALDRDPSSRLRLWSWDGRSWSVVPAQNAPSGASAQTICFDGVRSVLVLVRNNFSVIETWEMPSSTGTWTQVQPTGAPVLQNPISLHYARARLSSLLIGQAQGANAIGVWEYQAQFNRWQARSSVLAPTTGAQNTTYDSARNRIVLFSSSTAAAETWEWDGAAWTRRLPNNSPSARGGTAIAYDSSRHRCVIYGGSTSNPFTWEWDGDNWVMNLTAPPSPTSGRMAYDALRGRMVFVSDAIASETWEYFMPRQATYVPFGTACPGAGGLPALAAIGSSLPWLGETLSVRLTNLPTVPTAVPFGLMGSSRTGWLGLPLPLDLTAFGASGCTLYTSVDLAVQLVNASGTAQWDVAIPATIALHGAHFYQQAMVLDPSANSLGAVFTNAAHATIGDH